jgi:signal transduction histidine kinase
MKSPPSTTLPQRQNKLLLLFMVVIGYLITFAFIAVDDYRRFIPEDITLSIILGVIYLLIGLNESWIYTHLPPGWSHVLFFGVGCSLVFGIGLVLGVGGNVLIGLPLIGRAVERLKPLQRPLVYTGFAASLVLPLGLRFETWEFALINGVTATILILFVAMFAHLRQNEQQARERAEKLMLELEDANTRLAAYAAQAEELAMTQERNRLAREIHDNLGHYLTIVNVQIEAARAVIQSDPARGLDALNKAQDLTQKGLTRVRESVAALRESPVSNRPLSEAIVSLVEETQSSGLVTEFKVIGIPVSLKNKVALALYRASQEGLTNVRRHARASRVDVLLDFQPEQVLLEVVDNGVGAADTGGGFGLLGIRERVQLLGGRLEIDTSVGKGFCLRASVPVSDSEEPEGLEG